MPNKKMKIKTETIQIFSAVMMKPYRTNISTTMCYSCTLQWKFSMLTQNDNNKFQTDE